MPSESSTVFNSSICFFPPDLQRRWPFGMALVRLRRWASCSWIIWGRCWAPPLPASTKSATPSWAATRTSLRATTACRSPRCRCLVQKGYRNGKLWESHSNVVDCGRLNNKPPSLDISYIYTSRFSWNRTMVDFHTWIERCCSTCWVERGKGASGKKKIILGKSDEIVTDLRNLIWTFLNDLRYGTWRWPV